ncbi:hypothetical protein J4421_05185 [Candidatus Woesearchaeota archaeon]|nr:hypothetical protein [Candidatus Woesearchaeota archaeon]
MKKEVLVLFVILIFIIGCAEKIAKEPTEETPAEKIIKSTEPAREPEKPKTEIIATGQKGAELVISPSVDEAIKGTVTITMNNVPQETRYVGFYIERGDAEDANDGPPNLGLDNDGSDGWSLVVDTTAYDNNKYRIFALAFAEEPSSEVEPTGTVQAEVVINNPSIAFNRNYPTIIKGNWEPSTTEMTQILNSEVDELKELGVNTVSIVLEYNLNKDGSYYLEDEELYISQLRKAKKAGFAVLVSPNFVGAAGHNYAEEGINIDLDKHLQNSEEVALKWAKIAEQYQAEYFAPQNEFNGPIRGNFVETEKEEVRITSEWHKEMLPKLKGIFTGKLMAKLDNPREGIDVSGYDYVGMTISHGNGPLGGVRKWLADSLVILKKIGEKSNAHWLVSEAWFPYGGPWYSATKNEDGESLDELQDDYYKMSLEEYQKAGGQDYIFIAWLMPGMEIKDRPAEAVIKDYFRKI